jgi:hypothetical protein
MSFAFFQQSRICETKKHMKELWHDDGKIVVANGFGFTGVLRTQARQW